MSARCELVGVSQQLYTDAQVANELKQNGALLWPLQQAGVAGCSAGQAAAGGLKHFGGVFAGGLGTFWAMFAGGLGNVCGRIAAA